MLPFVGEGRIRISIGHPLCTFKSALKHPGDLHFVKEQPVFALALRPSDLSRVHEADDKRATHRIRLAELRNDIGRLTALRSLALVIETDKLISSKSFSQRASTIPDTDHAMPSLQEVHLDLPVSRSSTLDEGVVRFLDGITWSRLQRLSLRGNALIEEVLQAFSALLVSLHCLHLEAVRWLPTDPSHLRDFLNKDLTGRWSASKTAVARTSSFIREHAFEELKLEGFDIRLCVPNILSPKLRKLKLHMCELLPILARGGWAQLQLLSELAPNIEHLEIDVGRIGNLWQATAVPGVDVDVQIYRVLDAITALSHLRSLRLFPQYREGDDYYDSRLTQPLTDDAAVRLFQKLIEKSSSLETLAISSDNHVADNKDDFDPMSWELRAAGDKIILTVRQANHDYEQRQVWVGERRLTTEIKRLSYRKPYIPEFEGWIMES